MTIGKKNSSGRLSGAKFADNKTLAMNQTASQIPISTCLRISKRDNPAGSTAVFQSSGF